MKYCDFIRNAEYPHKISFCKLNGVCPMMYDIPYKSASLLCESKAIRKDYFMRLVTPPVDGSFILSNCNRNGGAQDIQCLPI